MQTVKFLENNFKYQNTHNNKFGGAISDISRGGMVPWYLV